MFGWILSALNPLERITGSITRAYEMKLRAQNDTQRIRAEQEIAAFEAKRDVIIAAQSDPWWSPRSIMGWSVAAFVFKLVVWDTVLGWGVTAYPGELVQWIVITVIGFYFASRSAETIASSIAGVLAKRK